MKVAGTPGKEKEGKKEGKSGWKGGERDSEVGPPPPSSSTLGGTTLLSDGDRVVRLPWQFFCLTGGDPAADYEANQSRTAKKYSITCQGPGAENEGVEKAKPRRSRG